MANEPTRKATNKVPAKQRNRRSQNHSREVELHPRYDPAVPLLKDLVSIHVDATDGARFDALLTRIPGLGEEIVLENRSYQVIRVQHFIVNDDGRAEFGYHAFIDAILRSED